MANDKIFIDDGQDDSGRPVQESTERIILLLRFLTANICTRKEIFDHLTTQYRIDDSDDASYASSRQLADRTFERDLAFLEEFGYEITKFPDVRDRRITRYHLTEGTGPTKHFLFTRPEIETLIALYYLFADPTRHISSNPTHPLPLQPPRHPFAEEILSLVERFVATLPEPQRRYVEQSVSKPYIYFNVSPVTDYLPYRPTIDFILKAITENQSIRFLYFSSRQHNIPVPHERVDPYYVSHIDGHFYLIGYSHKTQKFHEYRIDRIVQDSLKLQHYPIDRARRQRPIEFRYWADEDLVHGGLSQRWLTQTIEREEYVDDPPPKRRRVLVRATAYNDWRIIQQLHKYAHKVELVDPPELREKMQRELELTLRLYRK